MCIDSFAWYHSAHVKSWSGLGFDYILVNICVSAFRILASISIVPA